MFTKKGKSENGGAKDGGGGHQFMAELRGEYTIVDSENRVVYQFQYQPVRDQAERRRQDFYMYFPVALPPLEPGQYRLQLLVEDLIGNKVASNPQPLTFHITPAQPSGTPGAKTAQQPVGPAAQGKSNR